MYNQGNEAVASLRKWKDTDDSGMEWERNSFTVTNLDSDVTSEIINLPFGYGASVFDLGIQDVDSSNNWKEYAAWVAREMAQALPLDTPRSTIIQLGAVVDQDKPVSESNYNHFMLAVWAVNPETLAKLTATAHHKLKLSVERGESYTMHDLIQLNEFKACSGGSRQYRASLAFNALKAIGIVPPKENLAPGGQSIYDTMDFETVKIRNDADGEGTLHLLTDCNHPHTGAAVFHSPARGCTFYQSFEGSGECKRGCHYGIPASDGRVGIGPTNCDGLGHSYFEEYYVASPIVENENTYTTVDSAEGRYGADSHMHYSSYLKHCTKLHLKAIATAFPRSMRPNGKLYGYIPIDTISDVLQYLNPSEGDVFIDNTLEWQRQLCEADEQKRPFHLMNNDTAVIDKETGGVIKYRLKRSQLG